MPLFAPQFNKLVSAAKSYVDNITSSAELAATLPEANAYFLKGEQLFLRILPSLLRSEAMDTIIARCQLDWQEHKKAWSCLQEHCQADSRSGVAQALRELETVALHLADDYSQLTQEEMKEKIYSPFSVVDHFIKTGMNVLEGHATGQDLSNRFPQVVGILERTRRDVERFTLLYHAPQTSALMQKLLPNLDAGLGACLKYFQSGYLPALADGLKILGRATTAIQQGLLEMDKIAQAAHTSKHAYLNEYARSLELYSQGRLTWNHVVDAWGLVLAAISNYRHELQAFKRFPLAPFLQAQERKVLDSLERLEGLATTYNANLQFKIPAAPAPLEQAFDQLLSDFNVLWDSIEQENSKYREAPHFQELRERMGRVLQGEPAYGILKAPLESFQQNQQRLLSSLDTSCMPAQVGQQLSMALANQEEGCQLMLEGIHNQDLPTIIQGWTAIDNSMPALMAIAGQLRQALDSFREPSPTSKICIRCGCENSSEARYCKGCNAVLLTTQISSTEYTDIITGEKETILKDAKQTRINLLETMLQRVMEGSTPVEEAILEITNLSIVTRALLEKYQVEDASKLSPEHADFLTFFQEQIESYLEGLGWIAACLENGHLDEIDQGLAACYSVEAELEQLEAQISSIVSST